MTYTHMTRLVATAAGLFSTAAFVALASLPGLAETTVNSQESTSETRTYPGPGETPSGSPSVPGTSTYDDPGVVEDNQPEQEARRDSEMNSTPQTPSNIELYERDRDGIVDPAEIPPNSDQEPYSSTDGNSIEVANQSSNSSSSETENVGPSAVPGQTVPGPGETPSGSPSVPGVSVYDDPNYEGANEEDANPETMSPQNTPSDSEQDGPSAVPGEGFPGPGETPSGSPSVPGVSDVDDPGMN